MDTACNTFTAANVETDPPSVAWVVGPGTVTSPYDLISNLLAIEDTVFGYLVRKARDTKSGYEIGSWG